MTVTTRTLDARLIGSATRAAGRRTHKFRASTNGLARDGMILEATAWDLANYRRNPIVLAGHNYHSLPVGKAINVETDRDGLLAEILFDTDDPAGREIARKVDEGFLNAVSVGFSIKELKPGQRGEPDRITRAELLEISVVAVPSDPGALAMRGLRRSKPRYSDDPYLEAMGREIELELYKRLGIGPFANPARELLTVLRAKKGR